ncbi:Cell differentiation protein RCD1, partial [Tetrabaena socialis]
EIVSIYPLLSPPSLTAHASNRVCNALALLQCVASHNETRALFLQAHIPLFLYPFLQTMSKTRPFEYLRLTSLGVIGALVKALNTRAQPLPGTMGSSLRLARPLHHLHLAAALAFEPSGL